MKATHAGHCQACGRLQKLPSGRLSLHGYNVTHGFFSGVCVGSKHLPFEDSCDLIKGFIRNAEDQLKRVEGQQRHLRRPAEEPRCMVHAYLGTRKAKSSYAWREVTLIGVPMDHDPARVRYEYDVTDWQGRPMRRRIEDYSYRDRSALEVATEQNGKYANWLEHEADSLRRYIKWQRERVRTWKPAPRLPLNAQDKEGFEPTKPKY